MARATAHASLAVAILFSAATVISTVALALGLQVKTTPHPPDRPDHWYSVFAANLLVAGLMYLSGRARSRVYFVFLALNLSVWAMVLSQIVPWMQASRDWGICLWLVGYIYLEIYAYTLANAVGRWRLKWYPVPTLLAIAAYSEVAGIRHFVR